MRLMETFWGTINHQRFLRGDVFFIQKRSSKIPDIKLLFWMLSRSDDDINHQNFLEKVLLINHHMFFATMFFLFENVPGKS
jgi:hypothetical protein